MSRLEQFLAGERLEDVAIYLDDDLLDDGGKLAGMGDPVGDGVVLVVSGEKGRSAFAAGTGMDPMEFSRQAMEHEGTVDADLGGGDCPAAEDAGADHAVEFLFAFAEARNEGVGGMYADGDVMHAYAHCTCGTNYSQKWLLGERTA
ncbi:DUF5807 family protein [Halorarum halobium]|uniref:DUF5807 family protein n=1 Tax=Halorarum halobium TaxID=3075121 RepID=UPI0028AD0DE7|nr:DUF5807 family protein [Halobaculum sp. XH14]